MPVEINHTEITHIEWNVNYVLFERVSVVQMLARENRKLFNS